MNIYGPSFDLHLGHHSVYLFEFPDGKTYVGQCKKKPEIRWRGHYNRPLTEAIRQVGGIDKVKKSVLRTGLNQRVAGIFEAFYACKYHAYTNGYNIRPAGRSGAVMQLNKETLEPVGVWDSANQAERALGIPRSNIIAAIKGEARHSAGGFYWVYASALYLPAHLREQIEKKSIKAERAAAQSAQCREMEE